MPHAMQVACLRPISERCLRGALALATRRVVLRAPRGADAGKVCHGLEPSRVLDLSYRLALLAGGKSHIVKKHFFTDARTREK